MLGYLRDGTIAYVDVFPLEMGSWQGLASPWYSQHVADPSWRLRRFSGTGELLADTTFQVRGLPWPEAAYYCYGDLLLDSEWTRGTEVEAWLCLLDQDQLDLCLAFLHKGQVLAKESESMRRGTPHADRYQTRTPSLVVC